MMTASAKRKRGDDRRWYAVRTNPRCEERAERSIAAEGFEVYAPRLCRTIRHHRTKKIIRREFPLLVGYAFVALPASEGRDPPFGKVRECDGVKDFVKTEAGPLELPEVELEALRTLEGSQWLEQDLAMRKRVKIPATRGQLPVAYNITTGPLTGFLGRIKDGRDAKAIKVLTNWFGKVHEVTVREEELSRAA